MDRLKNFFTTSLVGGVAIILPVALILIIFSWLFGLVARIIQPLTNLLVAKSDLQEVVAAILVVTVIVGLCFTVGAVVRTRVGKFVHESLENHLIRLIPGYSMIKDIVMQFFGARKSPFSSVALIRVFGNDTLMTAFITDSHADGSHTVFVPTGPNPTSGNIYHLPAGCVHRIKVPVEVAMRSIISCGAGSQKLIEAYIKLSEEKTRQEGGSPPASTPTQ